MRELERICGGEVDLAITLKPTPEGVVTEARRTKADVIAVDLLRDQAGEIAALASRHDIAVVIAPLETETAEPGGRGLSFHFDEYERANERGERFILQTANLVPR